MSYRVHLTIKDNESGDKVFSQQVLGNSCRFTEGVLKDLNIVHDEEWCFEKQEVNINVLFKHILEHQLHNIKSVKEMYADEKFDVEDLLEEILKANNYVFEAYHKQYVYGVDAIVLATKLLRFTDLYSKGKYTFYLSAS